MAGLATTSGYSMARIAAKTTDLLRRVARHVDLLDERMTEEAAVGARRLRLVAGGALAVVGLVTSVRALAGGGLALWVQSRRRYGSATAEGVSLTPFGTLYSFSQSRCYIS